MLRNFRPIHAVTILATLAVTAIGVSLSFLLWDLHEREFKHAMLETESLTQMMMDQTAQNFDTADLVLQGVQERMLTPFGLSLPVDGPAVRLLLSSRISGLRHLRSLFIVDPQGMVANTSRPEGLARVSVADREYFKVFAEGRQEGLYIDRPVKHRTNGLWTLNLSRALIDAKGRFLGVVVAAFDINQFEQLYSVLKLDFERPVSIYLVDGTLVASVPHREELIGTQVPELLAQTALAPGVNARRHVTENGAIQTLSLGRLQNHPIVVSVINDHSEALGSWRETAVPIAVGAGLVWGPVAIYFLSTGAVWQGTVLVAYGICVIGLVDNILRPILVGKDTKMPDYLVLLSTLGGLAVFGLNGFVIGPVIAAMFMAVWGIFSPPRTGSGYQL